MSTSNAARVIDHFISGKMPRTGNAGTSLALVGAWGTGKTHFWKQRIAALAPKVGGTHRSSVRPHPKPRTYAYVSLFGMNSLDEIRTALTVDAYAHDGLDKKAMGTIKRLLGSATARSDKASLSLAALTEFADAVLYRSLKGALICIDDLERRGHGLSLTDVFGLATQLRDEMECDVALILNEDRFETKEDQEAYRIHHEKAVDVFVRFEPTPEEAFDIAFDKWEEERDLVAECCHNREVRNVRLLLRIRRTLADVLDQIDTEVQAIRQLAIRSVTFVTWACFERENAALDGSVIATMPNASEDVVHAVLEDAKDEENRSDHFDEPSQSRLLGRRTANVYMTYNTPSPLHTLIVGFVVRGWFDPEELRQAVEEEERAALRENGLIPRAWDLFYKGPSDLDEKHLAESLRTAYLTEMATASLEKVDDAIRLLRQLDRDDYADDLVERVGEVHQDDPQIRDWRKNLSFASDRPYDSKLEAKLDELAKALIPEIPVAEALKAASEHRLDRDGMDALKKANIDAYAEHLRQAGTAQIRAIYGFVGPEPAVRKKVVDALHRIAADSRIYRLRLERILSTIDWATPDAGAEPSATTDSSDENDPA